MNIQTQITYTGTIIKSAIIALEELSEDHFYLLLECFQCVKYGMSGLDTEGFDTISDRLMEDLYQAHLVIAAPTDMATYNMRPTTLAEELFEICDENGCVYVEPRDAFDTILRRTGRQLPLLVIEEN